MAKYATNHVEGLKNIDTKDYKPPFKAANLVYYSILDYPY